MEIKMEDKKRPFRPIPPGEIIKEELDARGWTQGDFAEITGKPLQAINAIIAGKRAIIPETAILFSKAFKTSPEFWLNLESAYRLDMLHQGQHKVDIVSRKAKLYGIAPVKELIKRGWIKASESISRLEAEVMDFFGISDIETPPSIATNFRRIIDTPALMAWVRKAEIEARKMSCSKFDPNKFKQSIKQLPGFSASDTLTGQIPQKLCKLGIRIVFIPHLPQTRVDGAAFWLDNKMPVVAISLRMDRADNYWFTLMHELAHLLESYRNNVSYIDNDIAGEPENKIEEKANNTAHDMLIPPDSFKLFVKQNKPYFSRNVVISFAQELGIHPAIVVGRLQYEELIPYTHLRNLISKVRPVLSEYVKA
ncbi:MAG TPA: addiction module antidote protein, HigA family [Nitrospirae bacterium]|nr:addiction module antidote protein, HigA family [Nitrospirota bacterium]HDZ62009.1 addiction module antidote protein, HigA family [Nitrospirota bacterium]